MKKLLIIGCGGHGKVVREIAEDIGYTDIAFLDDNSNEAIGKISDMSTFYPQYNEAFVSIGNNKFRCQVISKLEECGFKVPNLIHPTAYVSKSSTISNGCLIEPLSVINANSSIGKGSIVSVGAIVDHDVNVGEFCHINSGAVVKSGGLVESYTKIDAGEVK